MNKASQTIRYLLLLCRQWPIGQALHAHIGAALLLLFKSQQQNTLPSKSCRCVWLLSACKVMGTCSPKGFLIFLSKTQTCTWFYQLFVGLKKQIRYQTPPPQQPNLSDKTKWIISSYCCVTPSIHWSHEKWFFGTKLCSAEETLQLFCGGKIIDESNCAFKKWNSKSSWLYLSNGLYQVIFGAMGTVWGLWI